MSFKSISILAVTFLLITGLFQNCGPDFSANDSWNSSSETGGGQEGLVDPRRRDFFDPGKKSIVKSEFEADSPFDYKKLEPKKMVLLQLEYLKYSESIKGKAIAINSLGQGFVSIKDSGDIDAQQTALESCYVIGGGNPCLLLASGDKFLVSSQDLEQEDNFTFTLTVTNQVNAENIPFVAAEIANTIVTSYNAKLSPKALAVSVDGRWVIVSPDSPGTIESKEEAARLAFQRCEMSSVLSACMVVAADNEIVFNPQSPLALSIDYKKEVVSDSIPGARDKPFNEIVKPLYIDKLKMDNNLRGSIYITALGVGAAQTSAVSQEDANKKAKNVCEENNTGSNYACFKYAEGLKVLPLIENVRAYKQFPTLHCGIIPRASCEAHAEVGCTEGRFYVYKSTGPGVELENCP